MRKLRIGVSALVLLAVAAVAVAQGVRALRGLLNGYEEVPAVSSTGDGDFRARINEAEDEITYELSYRELEGNVLQAHIHLGQRGVNGGISVGLCGNPSTTPPVNPPAGTQACPSDPATITGVIRPSDVLCTGCNANNPNGQGIAAGEFDELVRAIRAGATYVNVHTDKHPGGEIRSQIGPGERHAGKGGGGPHDKH